MATAARLLHDKMASGAMGVVTIRPDASALDAAKLMNDHHIGALIVVSSGGRPVGIFTERDLLTRIVAARRSPESTAVEEVMTREMLVCPPEATMDDMRTLMREKRIRHIPIVGDKGLMGVISIGDLNAAEAKELSDTIVFLEEYMYPR
jgi:CBS domain-containing protein